MTNTELIQKIKAEIERLNNKMDDRDLLAQNQHAGYLFALADILSFLDTLESEKPMEKELEKEIDRYFEPLHPVDIQDEPFTQMDKCARHFAKWGYLRAAEKYNEIEYNRQRAEESVMNDIEQAADEYSNKAFPNEPAIGQWGTGDYESPVDMEYPRETAKDAFKVGAKWQKEQDGKELSEKIAAAYQLGLADKESQMMREAMKGEIKDFHFIREINYSNAKIEFNSIPELKEGDKVRTIIVKEN